MNAFFQTRVGSQALIDRVTVATVPRLVCTQPNPALTAVASVANITHTIEGSTRGVINDLSADSAGALFVRLLNYRFRYQRACSAARKQGTFVKDPPPAGHTAMLIGNVVPTAQCTWSIEFPESCRLMTGTVDEEISVVGWAWAMALLRDALSEQTGRVGVAGEADAARVAEQWARKAAAVLGFLAARAPAEMTVFFNQRMPPFCKNYACRAYQALAVAAAHIAQANYKAALRRGSEFESDIASHLLLASETLDAGYVLLKNEAGADDVGIELPQHYHAMTTAVFAASRFYIARYHVAQPQSLKVLYDHMAAAMALGACEQMRAGMQEMADAVAMMQQDMAIMSAATRLVTRLFTPRAINQDSETMLVRTLREMAPLDPPPDVPQIMPLAPEALVLKLLEPDSLHRGEAPAA